MYVLKLSLENQKVYFYKLKNNIPQVFTFNTIENAKKCIDLFEKYSISQVCQQGDPFGFGKIMGVCSSFEIVELPEMKAEKVSFEELMKEKGYEI